MPLGKDKTVMKQYLFLDENLDNNQMENKDPSKNPISVTSEEELDALEVGTLTKVCLDYEKPGKWMVYGGNINGSETFLEQSDKYPEKINSWESGLKYLTFPQELGRAPRGIQFSHLHTNLKQYTPQSSGWGNKLELLKAANNWAWPEELGLGRKFKGAVR